MAGVREARAARGVGALINDFFGVSLGVLFLVLGKDPEVGRTLDGGNRRAFPMLTNGCLSAACGFIRRSGSQTRHLEMKSTKSSSGGGLSL